MKSNRLIMHLIPVYALVFLSFLFVAGMGNKTISVMSDDTYTTDRHCIIIDAGHGGVDGGATSCTGILESQLNLEIALRLDDLMHLLGYTTKMIRTEDISIYTEGTTIAAKKVSDLKERVRIVNNTYNAILLSIHQNFFTDGRYSGAQVFFSNSPDSEKLAKMLQADLVKSLNPGSKRQAKKSSGIYLMEHIQWPGVLIECGFLSNPEECEKLSQKEYQKELSFSIVCGIIEYEKNKMNRS